MGKLTFLELAQKILSEEKRPLSPDEIWEVAVSKGYNQEILSQGKTPARTIGAQIYVHIRDRSDSPFFKVGSRPTRFSLISLHSEQDAENLIDKQPRAASKVPTFKESQLHPLLAYFAYTRLRAYTKTIRHQKSIKNEFGEWVHPDMVGCYFPIGYWTDDVIQFSAAISNTQIRMFSFELKRFLNFSNLRESFFQAVSNSSWANEGYLVASNISQDDDFLDELQRLSTSFGIGVIELSIDNPEDAAVLYPAKSRDYIDWEMINKLAGINEDFRQFIQQIRKDIAANEVRKEKYDGVLEESSLLVHINQLKSGN
jgi:hypothetical protein